MPCPPVAESGRATHRKVAWDLIPKIFNLIKKVEPGVLASS